MWDLVPGCRKLFLVVEEEQPEQLSLLSLEMSTEDLLVERVMQKRPLTAGKKNKSTSLLRPTPPDRNLLLSPKKLYGYEGFSGDEMGVKYAMFNSEGVTIDGRISRAKHRKRNCPGRGLPVSCNAWWMKAAICKPPVVSQPEQQDEVQPFSDQYRMITLDRLCAELRVFSAGAGQRAEKHLWALAWMQQIEKMRGTVCPTARKTRLDFLRI